MFTGLLLFAEKMIVVVATMIQVGVVVEILLAEILMIGVI